MALTSGSKLGPYEIVKLLGSGGMGEVYQAHDSRLGRKVALKVLREHLSSEEHRARFLREAKAASAFGRKNRVEAINRFSNLFFRRSIGSDFSNYAKTQAETGILRTVCVT